MGHVTALMSRMLRATLPVKSIRFRAMFSFRNVDPVAFPGFGLRNLAAAAKLSPLIPWDLSIDIRKSRKGGQLNLITRGNSIILAVPKCYSSIIISLDGRPFF